MNTRRSHKSGSGVSQAGNYLNYQQTPMAVDQKPNLGAIGTMPPSAVKETNGTTVVKEKPSWQLRKTNPKLRRLRQNARVKRVVQPRTAVQVLHEICPDIVYKIDEVASNKTSIYRVHFEYENKQYAGEGFSKTCAKQNACENALRQLLLERLAKEQESDKKADSEKLEDEKDDSMEDDKSQIGRVIPTDDFPWGKLAGFALQKLVEAWTEKPTDNVRPTPPTASPFPGHQTFSNSNHVSFSNYQSVPVAPPPVAYPEEGLLKRQSLPRKKFPDNPLEHNPVALFNQTWPYVEPMFDVSRSPEGHPIHTAGVTLEGFRFSAAAKNKKEVKTQLAKAIISTLKGVKYADGFNAQVMQA